VPARRRPRWPDLHISWETPQQQLETKRVRCAHRSSYPDETPALEQVAPTIETPVLVLHGERDTFVGIGNSRRLSEALSNSEFHVIPEAGHYAWEDNSEPYLAYVLHWINQAEANS
jgi:pimeloyl-ACP methyl ester carboxylesterase